MAEATDSLVLKYVPINQVVLWGENPKRHEIEEIASSIRRYGFRDPASFDPHLNDGQGGLVEGNGRTLALRMMHRLGEQAPRGIEVDGDHWLMPVLYGVESVSPSEAEAYAIDHNNLVLSGGEGVTATDLLKLWEPSAKDLIVRLGQEDSLPVSISARDLAEMWGVETGEDEDKKEEDEKPLVDKAEELQKKWNVQPGDLWIIQSKAVPGMAHRLVCGDSADPVVVERLMQKVQAVLMATDPPYGVDFKGQKYNPRAKEWAGIEGDTRQGLTLEVWLEGLLGVWLGHMARDSAFYFWTAAMEEGAAAAKAIRAAGLHIQSQVIWNKNAFALGQADYQWKHEDCWYAFFKGEKHRWFGGRAQTTVWEVDKVANASYLHPMQKPTELYAIPMRNHTLRGDVCAEPFAGSGSQFVAGEQEGRLVYGCELEPKFCAVVLERLSDLGLEPHLDEAVEQVTGLQPERMGEQ